MLRSILYILLFIQSITASTTVSNIIIVADIHGDITRFKEILRDAKVIDKQDEWIAPENTLVIQLGDQIDQKDVDKDDISKHHHFASIYYTNILQEQAKAKNCNFISHIGNHELMNIDKIRNKPDILAIIASRPIVSIVNNYLFCHGGFRLDHYNLLNKYNKTINDINTIWYKYVHRYPLTTYDQIILDQLILDTTDSILYTRTIDDKNNTKILLQNLDIEYVFVGHTQTKYIYMKHNIWRLDLLLKTAFDSNSYNYIHIIDDNIVVKHVETLQPPSFINNIFT